MAAIRRSRRNFNKWISKDKLLFVVIQTYQKRKEWPFMEMSRDNNQKRKESPYKEISRDTSEFKSSDLYLSNHCSVFILKNQLASFSYQHSISFTHGLRHYKNLGQTDLHRLCGFWQESRQIWTLFLVQKWLQLVGYQTKSVPKGW